jgi:hypothetical protein
MLCPTELQARACIFASYATLVNRRAAIDGEVLEEVTFAVRPAPTPRA